MMKRSSYTLIELIIIVVLLGIVTGIGFVAIGSFRAHHLRGAADQISHDLKYIRNLALTSSQWHGAAFNVGGNSYSLYSTNGVADANLKRLYDASVDFVVDLAAEYNGISFSNVNIGGGSKIEFNPQGQPFTDLLGAALAATAEVTLSDGASTLSVLIEPETGRVFIQ